MHYVWFLFTVCQPNTMDTAYIHIEQVPLCYRVDRNLWTNYYGLSWWDVHDWYCRYPYFVQWAAPGGGPRDGLQPTWGASMWWDMCEREECLFRVPQKSWINKRVHQRWLVSYRFEKCHFLFLLVLFWNVVCPDFFILWHPQGT